MADSIATVGALSDESRDVLLDLVQEPAVPPELSFGEPEPGDPIQSIALTISESSSSLQVDWASGASVDLDHASLDDTVQALAGRVPGLTATDPSGATRWDAQLVLQGSGGNDRFSVADRPFPEGAEPALTTFLATAGSDRYLGSVELDRVDYAPLSADGLSGLYISDDPASLPLVAANLPPLLGEAFASDSLLVYKSAEEAGAPQIDLLTDIELISLGAGADHLELSHAHPSLVVDFGDGDDSAVLTSAGLQPDVAPFVHLESLEWRPLGAAGEPIRDASGDPLSLAFDVHEALEDRTTQLLLDAYPPPIHPLDAAGWSLTPFALPGESAGVLPDWIALQSERPTPDLVGDGRVVVYSEWSDDPTGSNRRWLEIHVQDRRPDGLGLIGLELNLHWNAAALDLQPAELYAGQMFNSKHLPLFQDTGTPTAELDGREGLTGLAAAALPNARQGVALGRVNAAEPQTLFARLLFDVEDPGQLPDLQLDVSLAPAAGGVPVRPEQLLVLDDRSPLVWSLLVSPDQPEVGSHAFTLTRSNGQTLEQRHLALVIRNVNDAPQAIPAADLPLEALAASVLQGAEIDHDLASLFRDQDHAQLQLSLLESPPWLHLDAQTGRLIGTPANGDVGVHQITVQAQDAKGARAEQQVTITVWNVNDAPEAGVVIAPPDLLQDQSFTYRLPSGAFRDPDLLLNLGEQLHYELEAPSWLQIDAATGTLTGTPGPGDVGTTPVVVRAIDASGAMAEQAVSITVANVNDAPFRSEALLAVLEEGLSIDNGSLHQLDLSAWFSDPDLGFDPEEILNLELALDDGTGRFIALDPEDESEPMAWLQWDAASSQLTMAPGASEIGEHYLRVVASDRAGRQAAALVPLAVRHPNTSPTLQWPPTEQELAAWHPQGVEQVLLLPDSSGLELLLLQEEQVLLQLPAQLFQDADLGLDPNEQLSIRIDGAETLLATQPGLPGLRFDPVNLTISGSTHGLGLNQAGGFSRWSAQLVATDRAGSSVSLALQLSLQRSAPEPVLSPLAEPDQLWPEGTPIPLAELLALELPDVEGQVLDVTIEQRQPLDHPLEWFAPSGLVPEMATQIAEDARPLWRIHGTAEQVQAQLAELCLHPAPGTALEAPMELLVSVQSELGSTGLRSQAVQQAIRFSIDPQATTPVWSTEQPEPSSDPFILTPFGTQLNASSSDPKEEISYRLTLPPDRADLVITDASGTALGVVDGDALVLSAAEWAAAVLRSRDGQLDPVALELQAQSREPSNNLTAASAPLTVQWAATPLLDQSAALALELPRELQRAGEISRLPLQLDWPPAARSAAIQIELPSGSSISLGGVLVQPEPPVEPGSARFVIQLQPDAAGELPGSVELEIRSPELFQGPLEGMATLLSSARASESTWTGEGWGADLDGALAAASAAQAFQWDVVQMARLPEFPSEADANQAAISFEPATGALLIPIRRGATASGVRNPAEALTLAVSNIPAGYALAEKVGDAYQAVGATDVFGTLTLFTVPPAPADAADSELERFDPLNGGNLYLVALEENPPALAGVALQLNLTARVADQELADSRSGAVFHSLSLTDLLVTPPLLAVSPELVDPLILDLSGSGRVPLTALPADGGSISFAMLPGSAAMPTAWLAPEANADGLAQAAFVVLNDPGNDLDGDVTISSITELFSEYFQADGRQRSFASGSAALASLDSNADGLLNSADALWNRLQLWFDDGDARTQAGELRPLSETLQSIDLDSLTTLASQPDWVSGNAVLRSLNATASSDGNRLYPLYDVGLRVAPAGAAPLDLQVQGPLVLQEEGDAMALRLNSAGSEAWLEDGRAGLTLVRLSGMPAAVLPSLGVQDARGDWLFTWADLAAAGGTVQLIPGVDWSGSANLQVLISQLQGDGRLLSSALTSMALDVEAVADAPLLLLRAATTLEDTPIALQQLVQIAELRDRDGSETLQFELHDLPAGVQVVRSGGAAPAPLQAVDGVIRFSSAELPDLLLVPPAHRSGRLSFDWHALATEANGDVAITVARAQIMVRAVADAPAAVAVAPVLPNLREGASVSLASLIVQQEASAGLIDTDGSEQLRLEITMPDVMRFSHAANPGWAPLSVVSGNGLRTVVVSAADVGQLQLVDRGLGPVDEVNLTITRISRELSNGDQARSAATTLQLPVARNARPATLTRLTSTGLVEDGAPLALSDLVQVQPAHAGDSISYHLSGLTSGLSLVDGQGLIQVPPAGQTQLTLASLEGYQIRPDADRAGTFYLDLQVVSTPPGGGATATATQRLSFSVAALADRPSLQMDTLPQQPMELGLNGWLDLAGLKPALSSSDRDGSEQLALIIGALNPDGQPQALPPQARFNVPASQLDDGRWLIPQAGLADLRLYLGEIGDALTLVLTPRASEGSSRQEGDPVTLTVAANAVVRVPLLEVSGELQGLEDQLIPLFSQLGGVIAATPRGNGAGQTLELEISGLPEGASLVQLQAGGPPIPLNRTAGGASITSLRLPYSQWQGVHWQGPADQSGPMSFQVQAFSVGRTGVVKATEISTVQVRLTAVNDAPRLVDAADLEAVQEGSLGQWDLRSRFTDLDNADADLRITAVQQTAAGEQPLPAWLRLGSDGVLRGTPGNADVGSLQLKVTATDPLGEALTAVFHLAVGDLNAAPQLDPSARNNYTLDLRQTQQIQLTGLEAAFSDEDSIHGDQLSFTISQDGQVWSTEVKDLASIADGVLTIRPNAKWTVGEQQLQLRATDRSGASAIQQLQLQVNNVNDPPLVSRPGAELISAGLWRETVQVQEGDSDWQLNLQGLFTDADLADSLTIQTPSDFPAWLNLSAEGVLNGKPGNTDVGVVELEWQASDPAGARATYRLELEVLNLNQAPEVLGPDPGFTLEAKEESYSRLDLSTLFSDVDSIHGDRLRYSVQVVREGSEAAEEDPEWLGVVYRQPEPPDASGKLLVQPVFYRVDAAGIQGERVAAEELQELAIDTLLRVVIEATDDRAVNKRGLVGMDLDLSWSPSLELVAVSTVKISKELPLFNDVLVRGAGLRVQAGSAPDGLRIGGAVGDRGDQAEALLQFDVRLKDPKQTVLINVSPGQGVNRDGLLDRTGQQLTADNSVIHSFASEAGADLQILAPANEAVGFYTLTITATDQGGATVSTKLPLHIANTNDAPVLLKVAQDQLRNMLGPISTAEHPLLERATAQISNLRLFADQDLIHTGVDVDALEVKLVSSKPGEELKDIALQSDAAGNISLTLAPSRGLVNILEQTFRLEATDRAGQSIATDWFTAVFQPMAEQALLTTGSGDSMRPLEEVETGFRVSKNLAIDLEQILGLNLIEVADREGDDVFLNIRIPEPAADLKFLLGIDGVDGDHSFMSRALFSDHEAGLSGVLFSVSLDQLRQYSGGQLGDLGGLYLTMPDNHFALLPADISKTPSAGLGIELWTETRVRGDGLNRFGSVESQVSKLWVEFVNARPEVRKPEVLELNDQSFKGSGQVLFSLSAIFSDPDPGDALSWRVEIPTALSGLVAFDPDRAEIRLAEHVSSLSSLPGGLHRFVISARDSSGLIGDRSGMSSVVAQLLVVPPQQVSSSGVNGLNLLMTIGDAAKIKELLAAPSQDLDSAQKEMVDLVSRLSIPASDIEGFVQKLAEGSLAVVASAGPGVLVMDASSSQSVIANPAIVSASPNLLSAAKNLLLNPVGVEAPIGQLSFDLGTQGRDYAVLQIALPDGVGVDSLIKTDSLGNPYVFHAQNITWDEERDGALGAWLQVLPYGIYGYGLDGSSGGDDPILMLPADGVGLSAELLKRGFDLTRVDGSAYLVDLDSDGVADVISMLLIDGGWFDTNIDSGVIGDPLIPVQLTETISPSISRSSLELASVPDHLPGRDDVSPSPSGRESDPSPVIPDVPVHIIDRNPGTAPPDSGSVLQSSGGAAPLDSGGNSRHQSSSSEFNAGFFVPAMRLFGLFQMPGINQPALARAHVSADLSPASHDLSEAPLPGNAPSGGQSLTPLRNWLQARQRDASDWLNSLLEPILQQPSEASMTAVLAMLVGPVMTERMGTRITRSIRQSPKLQLTQRDPNFHGRWLMPSRDGRLLLIERNRHGLLLDATQPGSDDHSALTLLPGFDLQGRSLLSQALPLCRQPGLLMQTLLHLNHELQHSADPDIHWQAWLDTHFERAGSGTEALAALDGLQALLQRALQQDPALADVVMLSQLQDCCDQLGLSGLRSQRRPRTWPHQDAPTLRDAAP